MKDLENGLSNKDVATKYGIQQNTASTWVKIFIDDLDCLPPLTWPFKGDIEEALDKLQDLSLLGSYVDETRSLTLKIETILNKKQIEDLKQSHLTNFF